MKKHIGLFFGTFNPIHVGHLIIANYMVDHAPLDEVWLVVTPQNPLKDRNTLLPDIHRLQIARLAVEDNPKLKVSSVEFDLPKPSYTIHTLTYLEEKYPEQAFALIMGEDNLRSFHRWKNHQQILARFEILVYPRNSSADGDEAPGPSFPVAGNARIRRLEAPVMNISATYIRESIRKGRDVRYLLTEPVERYVREMHFYSRDRG